MIARIEEHYKNNFNSLVKKMIKRCGIPEDAEDIVQNAYYRAMKYKAGFDGSMPFDNWFARILNNSLREFQNAKRAGDNVVSFDEEEVEGTHDPFISRESFKEIKDRIKKHPNSEILYLHFIHEYRPVDIAKIVDDTPGNIRKIVFRFRDEIKDKFK